MLKSMLFNFYGLVEAFILCSLESKNAIFNEKIYKFCNNNQFRADYYDKKYESWIG